MNLKRLRVPSTAVSFNIPDEWTAHPKDEPSGCFIQWQDHRGVDTFNLVIQPAKASEMTPPLPPYRMVAEHNVNGVKAVEAELSQSDYSSRKLGLTHEDRDFYWTFPASADHSAYHTTYNDIIASVQIGPKDGDCIEAASYSREKPDEGLEFDPVSQQWSVSTTCPHCGATINLPPDTSRAIGRCSACGETVDLNVGWEIRPEVKWLIAAAALGGLIWWIVSRTQ